MHILVVVPWYNRIGLGGVRIAVERISRALILRGHKISILIQGEENRIKYLRNDDGIAVYSIYYRSLYSQDHRLRALVAFIFYLIPTLLRIREFIKQNKIDVTTIFYPGISDIHFFLLKKLFGLKYAVSVRGSDIKVEAKEHWAITKGLGALIRNADGFIPCSMDMLRETKRLVHYLPRRTEVIYTGIDPNWGKDSLHGEFNFDRQYILSLAWATPVKGPDIVIKAFAKVHERYTDIDLIMVGSGPIEYELRELINSLGLDKRILRLGDIEYMKVAPIYRDSLFGVIPSRSEGFPKVVLEFGLMKKAVVATAVGGIPEIIEDGVNGYLVPPDDIEAMAQKMGCLLENPNLCRISGEKAHEKVIDLFSLEKTGAGFERMLTDIIAGQ